MSPWRRVTAKSSAPRGTLKNSTLACLRSFASTATARSRKVGCCCLPSLPHTSSLTYVGVVGGDFTAWRRSDEEAAAAKRKADEKAAEVAARALALKRMEKKNAVNELPVFNSVAELDSALEDAGSAGGAKKGVLSAQYDVRQQRFPKRDWEPRKTLPPGSAKGIAAEVAHLRAEVVRMIEFDHREGRSMLPAPEGAAAEASLKRRVPVPDSPVRSRLSQRLEEEDRAAENAVVLKDDADLIALEQKYLHKKFTDTVKGKEKGRMETNESYVVLAVIWSKEADKWLAECAELDSEFEIPASSKTAFGTVKRSCLVYYLPEVLGELILRFEATAAE